MVKKVMVTAVLAALMLIVLTGCGGQDLTDHELVGTWNWDNNARWQYNFNADGTGTRGLPDEIQSFNWSIPGEGRLRLSQRGYRTENWDYTIDGQRLTLDSRQVADLIYHYTNAGAPPEINQDLVGKWTWDDNPEWEYILSPDGNGTRGFADNPESFTWLTPEDGHIRINLPGGMREDWSYTLDGARLILDSRQLANVVYNYTRAD